MPGCGHPERHAGSTGHAPEGLNVRRMSLTLIRVFQREPSGTLLEDFFTMTPVGSYSMNSRN